MSTPPLKEDNAPPARKPRRGKHKEVVVLDGPKIIMDLQWGALMNDKTQKKVVSQASMAYSFDKLADKSVQMVFSSIDTQWRELFHRVNGFGWSKKIVSFSNDSLLEIAPASEMIYLTADTDNVCQTIDPTKYYVIGCILDHNSKKGLTREYAIKNNIRMERLPIPEYIKMDGRHVLTINHVAEIIVRVANGESWPDALLATIPQRKNPQLVNQDSSEKSGSLWDKCNVQ